MTVPLQTTSPFPDGDLGEAAELGAVTERGVRVWVRRPGAATVTARLEVEGRPPVTVEIPVAEERDWTGAAEVALAKPAPNAPFVVTVGERRLRGRFAPAPGEHAGFVFGFGSCHQPFGLDEEGRVRVRAAARIYPAIRAELAAADARLLLLVGDQLYGEALAPISIRNHLPGDAADPPPMELALAAYRRATRGFFAESGFRALRESLPTLCMWDDHEIFNNWGSLRTERALDQRLFAAASLVYRDYQHARNTDAGTGRPAFDYVHRVGTTGFLVLDVRGARSYADGRILGTAQWERVQAFLQGPAAADLETLFVVASVPVAHAARWFAMLLGWLPGEQANDVRDRWVSFAFRKSRDEFLDALFRWETIAPNRQVFLLSGDIHQADAVWIRRRDAPGAIWQFTSSALTTPLKRKARFFNWVATRAPNLFESRYRFERRFLVPRNNYGLVRLIPLPAGGHRVEFTVRAWDRERRALVDAGVVCAEPEGAGTAPFHSGGPSASSRGAERPEGTRR